MPSNQSSDEIDHDSNEDCAEPENVDPPFPPNRPNSINAHSISESEVEADVKDLQDRLKSAEKWMIGLTGAIAFFALCQVGAGLLQWRAMEDQLAEIRSGSGDTHTLALAAKKEADKAEAISTNIQEAVTQMKSIAGTAERSVNANIAASRMDERAWIEIAPMKPFDVVDGPLTSFNYNLIPKNVGKTAARKIVVRVVPLLLGTIQQTKNPLFIHRWQTEILVGRGGRKRVGIPGFLPNSQIRDQEVLGPGEAFPIPIVLGGSSPSTDQQNSQVVSEIIGRIDYLDEFGIPTLAWILFLYR